MKLLIVPCELGEANAFVRRVHRHHGPVVGHRYSLAAAVGDRVVGVCIVGRPISRGIQDGFTLEVTRLATDGTPNACSALYAAAWRAARALGYRRMVTYILGSEAGTSLRAAGWRQVAAVRGCAWHTPSRPRVARGTEQDKLRFEVGLEARA